MGTVIVENTSGRYVDFYVKDPIWSPWWVHKKKIPQGSFSINTPKYGLFYKFVDSLGRSFESADPKDKLYNGGVVVDTIGLRSKADGSRGQDWNRPLTLKEKTQIADLAIKALALKGKVK